MTGENLNKVKDTGENVNKMKHTFATNRDILNTHSEVLEGLCSMPGQVLSTCKLMILTATSAVMHPRQQTLHPCFEDLTKVHNINLVENKRLITRRGQ